MGRKAKKKRAPSLKKQSTAYHLAPSCAIYVHFGKAAMVETYLMSNICPQKAALNSGRWNELEQTVGQDRSSHGSLAASCKEVWVITGPIYDADIQRLKSGVEIPDAFFKIVLDVDEETKGIRVLAFIMPNEKCKGELAEYLVAVDEVESKTGLDFYWELEDGVEEKVEGVKAEGVPLPAGGSSRRVLK